MRHTRPVSVSAQSASKDHLDDLQYPQADVGDPLGPQCYAVIDSLLGDRHSQLVAELSGRLAAVVSGDVSARRVVVLEGLQERGSLELFARSTDACKLSNLRQRTGHRSRSRTRHPLVVLGWTQCRTANGSARLCTALCGRPRLCRVSAGGCWIVTGCLRGTWWMSSARRGPT